MTSRTESSELKAARARIAELEAREAEHTHAEQVQAALYRIAETASAATDMPSFYASIHEIVGSLMYADNFYIALYDEERQAINFPFFLDEVEPDIPDPNVWSPFGIGDARGATAYLLRKGEPQFWDQARMARMQAAGEIQDVGALAIEWLGVPLIAEGRTQGVLAVQTYRKDRRYKPADLDLLTFVGQHVASALTRARAIEETRHRNAGGAKAVFARPTSRDQRAQQAGAHEARCPPGYVHHGSDGKVRVQDSTLTGLPPGKRRGATAPDQSR